MEQARVVLTARGSSMTASMLRDVEGNAPVEADHVVGDLLRRRRTAGANSNQRSMLETVYTHLKAYETRRVRMLASTSYANE
jgi:2-dehydropantoate 2-reductase